MKNIDIYVDSANHPQHLAVPNEQFHHLETKGLQSDGWRPLCGANPQGLSIINHPAKDIQLPCPNCNEQLNLRRDVESAQDGSEM